MAFLSGNRRNSLGLTNMDWVCRLGLRASHQNPIADIHRSSTTTAFTALSTDRRSVVFNAGSVAHWFYNGSKGAMSGEASWSYCASHRIIPRLPHGEKGRNMSSPFSCLIFTYFPGLKYITDLHQLTRRAFRIVRIEAHHSQFGAVVRGGKTAGLTDVLLPCAGQSR